MDVRLPDGTVITGVPDNFTKAQLIEKLRANGYDVSKLEPQKESNLLMDALNFLPSLGDAAARGVIGAGSRALTGVQAVGGGLSSLVGREEEAAQRFKAMENRQQATEQFLRETYPDTGTFKEKLVGGAAQIPSYINPFIAGATIMGTGIEEQQRANQLGVDPETAKRAGYIGSVGNATMMAIPGAGAVKGALVGGGTAFAGEQAQVANLALSGYDKAAEERKKETFEATVIGTIIGAGGGAATRPAKPKPKSEDSNTVLSNLKSISEEKKQQAQTEVATAEQQAAEAAAIQAGAKRTQQGELGLDVPNEVDVSNLRNPYDVGGRISDLAAGMETTIDSPQMDLFAQGLREQAYNRPDIQAAELALLQAKDRARSTQEQGTINRELEAGYKLLEQDKPRDAFGRPLYDQQPFLVQPGGVQEGVPIAMRPETGVVGKDPNIINPLTGEGTVAATPNRSIKDATANLMDAIASATGAKQNFLKDGGIRTAAKDFVNALWDAGSRKWSEVLAKGRELFGDTWRNIGQVVKAEWDSFVAYQKAVSAGKAGSFAVPPDIFKVGDRILTKDGLRGTVVSVKIRPKKDLSAWYAKRQELHDQAFQGYMAGQHTFEQATEIFKSLESKNEDVLYRLYKNTSNEVDFFPKVLLDGETRPKTLFSSEIETKFSGPQGLAKPFVPKGQRGALDIAQIKEGFKPLYRALSKLTDQQWVKNKFPASEYESNPDGTPLIMLHGTSKQYDKIKNSPEGIHLGFVVPSHLIFTTPGTTPSSVGLKPKEWSKAVEYPTEPTKLYRNFSKDSFTKIRNGANIRPYTIKKGNYPELPFDFGSWDPRIVIPQFYTKAGQRFIDYLMQSAQEKSLPTSKNRFDFLLSRAQSTIGFDAAERASAFNQALKEAGIDGFFYKNKHESLRIQDDRYATAADAVSFVTWNANNVKNIYEGGSSGFVPKGQRGSVDPDLLGITKALNMMSSAKTQISKAVDSALNSMKFPKSTEEQKSEAFKSIPGMEDTAYISKDPVFENEKPTILAEGKDGSSVWALNPGRVASQQIRNSHLIKVIGRLFENARNRAEYAIRNNVMPLKKAVQAISRNDNDVILLHKIFMEELKNGSKFTPEELVAAGASREVAQAHLQMRENFDAILVKQNEARVAAGLKPIKALDAYYASRWEGPWTAEVRDISGKLLYFIREPTSWGLKRAMDWVQKGYPDLVITKRGYDKNYSMKKDRIDEGYDAMLAILGPDDPIIKGIDEWRKKQADQSTENVLGQERHFKEKGGVMGFAGGRPWKEASTDARDFIRQQLQYIENGYRWAENQNALREMKKYTSDADIKNQQLNNLEYVRELSKLELGIGTKEVFQNIENAIASGFGTGHGLSPAHMQMTLGMSKAFFYLWNLGLSAPYIAISLLQPAQVLPAALLSSKASFADAAKALQDGPYVFARQMVDDYNYKDTRLTGLIAHVKGKEGVFLEEAYRYARDNRVTEVNQLSDIRDPANTMGVPRSVETLNQTVGLTISVPEIAARSFTYMSFVNGLKHKYDISTKEGRIALFEDAAENTKAAMGDYNSEQKAAIFQRMGMAGNALSTLQTFIFNQMFQLAKYSKQAAKGDPKPLIAYLGMTFAMAGATGMIAVDDMQELMNTIKRLVDPDIYKWIEDRPMLADPKAWMVQNSPDLFSYGLVSNITGTNINTRFSMGDILNAGPFESNSSTIVESFLPFMSDIAKKGVAAWDMGRGIISQDPKKMKEAGYVLTPSGLRGLYEEKVPGFRQGTNIMQPRDLKKKQVDRPLDEAGKRMIGFRSTREQKELDLEFARQTSEKIRNDQLKDAGDKLQNAIFNQKGVAEALSLWVELGGNPANLNPMFKRYILDQSYTQLYQQAMKARSNSPAERIKAQRAIEIINELQR